jgi:hypothetical protein
VDPEPNTARFGKRFSAGRKPTPCGPPDKGNLNSLGRRFGSSLPLQLHAGFPIAVSPGEQLTMPYPKIRQKRCTTKKVLNSVQNQYRREKSSRKASRAIRCYAAPSYPSDSEIRRLQSQIPRARRKAEMVGFLVIGRVRPWA